MKRSTEYGGLHSIFRSGGFTTVRDRSVSTVENSRIRGMAGWLAVMHRHRHTASRVESRDSGYGMCHVIIDVFVSCMYSKKKKMGIFGSVLPLLSYVCTVRTYAESRQAGKLSSP